MLCSDGGNHLSPDRDKNKISPFILAMKINKYFPFAFVYFFVNSLALPFGVTYTAILAPFFYFWIVLRKKREFILPFIAILSPFILVQLSYAQIERKVYFNSLLNLVLVYIFCVSVSVFVRLCKDLEKVFKPLLVINFFLCLAALAVYFTPWRPFMWIEQNITEGVEHFWRMKLFTYEASYYATLFIPLFCFYMLQFLFRQNKIKGWLILCMIIVPYLLSFSFGVIAALIASGLLTYLFYFRSLTRQRRVFNGIIFTVLLSVVILSLIYIFFPDNFLVVRLENIISGNDTSGNGRTSDAFFLAQKLIEKRNEYWGVGLGQIKIMGEAILRNYYMYDGDFIPTIPNAAAETLAIFGWIGFILRLAIEVSLFFITKTWTNYYRLWLFLFMFLYQFTGSFITNIAEYVIWILAFTNVFCQFDAKTKLRLGPILLPRLKVE